MAIKTEICELTTGLREIEIFLGAFDEFAKGYTKGTDPLDYANVIISMISMQLAKVRELIEIAEKLGKESNKSTV